MEVGVSQRCRAATLTCLSFLQRKGRVVTTDGPEPVWTQNRSRTSGSLDIPEDISGKYQECKLAPTKFHKVQ